jgi:hypothetical protein
MRFRKGAARSVVFNQLHKRVSLLEIEDRGPWTDHRDPMP